MTLLQQIAATAAAVLAAAAAAAAAVAALAAAALAAAVAAVVTVGGAAGLQLAVERLTPRQIAALPPLPWLLARLLMQTDAQAAKGEEESQDPALGQYQQVC